MATKTTTKSPARKPGATARKAVKSVPQKTAAPKAKENKPRHGERPPDSSERAGKVASAPAAATSEFADKPAATKKPESLSLIDEVKPKPKSADGQNKIKKAILPPISRLISKAETVMPASSVEPPAPPPVPEA